MAEYRVRIRQRVSGDDLGLPTSLEELQAATRRVRVVSPGACAKCRSRAGEMAPDEDVKLHYDPPCRCQERFIEDD